jgi:ketosteroid isomerase-like protein
VSVPARWAAIGIAALALAGAWAWWNGAERQIRRTLNVLADGLSHSEVASPLGAVSAVAEMQALLAEDVVVEPGGRLPPISGRPAVLAAAARVRTEVPALRLEFVDVTVTVSEDGAAAAVEGTVSAVITDRAGQQRTDAREFTAAMRLVDGRWILARARAVDVLEPVS